MNICSVVCENKRFSWKGALMSLLLIAKEVRQEAEIETVIQKLFSSFTPCRHSRVVVLVSCGEASEHALDVHRSTNGDIYCYSRIPDNTGDRGREPEPMFSH
jgi:hypothetical protein